MLLASPAIEKLEVKRGLKVKACQRKNGHRSDDPVTSPFLALSPRLLLFMCHVHIATIICITGCAEQENMHLCVHIGILNLNLSQNVNIESLLECIQVIHTMCACFNQPEVDTQTQSQAGFHPLVLTSAVTMLMSIHP